MSDYRTTTTWEEIRQRVHAAARIAVVTHSKPDGDAMGSALALSRALSGTGKFVDILLMGPIEPGLRQAAGATPFHQVETGLPAEEPDLIMVVDTGSWSQLEAIQPWLRERQAKIVGIDHHARGDDVAPLRVIDPSCASTTQLLASFLDHLGIALTPAVAEALFLGLATDTGWFRFSNADARVFQLAARLLAAGADKERLFALVEENDRPEKLQLKARAIQSMSMHDGGAVCVMRLTTEDFAQSGARPEDLTGLVNEPMSIAAVRVVALLTEFDKGITKVSFRSKPGVSGAPLIDVNVIAARLGGGGHVQAAGAKVKEPLVSAESKVLAALGLR